MKKSILLLMLCLLGSIGAIAQNKTITGVVTDQTGETVIGASVLVKGTTLGTITDFDGKFTLNDVKNGDIIQISFVGYKTQEIKYTGQALNVVLHDDTEVLDEVVITGYGGSQKRATLTTAISKLDNAVLKNAAYSNAGQSLQGSVTGLRVINTTGQPGSNPDITLRGGATITGENSNALVVVDGIVRNSMSDVNPSDIESIQVLKDAASTAIYGARANGGVILIETKSGKEGKTSINYKFKIGKNFTRKGYEFCSAEDYIYYNRLGYKRTGRTNVDTQQGYGIGNNLFDIRYLTDETADLQKKGWSTMDDPFFEGKQILFKDYSGQLDDEVFSSSAITQDHYLNITGGNDKSTFASSLGYYNEDGMIKGTGFKRFSGSFNGSYKILPILNVKAGVSYVWSTRPELWTETYGFFYRNRAQRPTWNPWNEDGSPASGFGIDDGNPAYYRDRLTQNNSTARATYNMGFTLDILPKELVLSGNASLVNYQYQREKFNKAYQTQIAASPETTRRAEAWIQKYNQIQLNASLAYTKTFAEKHNLDVMVGGEYYTYDQLDFEAKTEGSPTDDVPTLNVGSTRTLTRTEKTGYRILSGFGRVNYNYNLKYLLSITARYDGISRLKDNRWGFFPGVSVGWNIMEEEFWKESKVADVISNLKPRLSYGVNGNVNGIGNYEVYGEYGTVGSKTYGGATALYNSKLVNTNLRWEQSQTFEVGLDIGFFQNRLSLILDYYSRKTKDLLTKQALPGYTGFADIVTNQGTLRNSGFEAEIKANIINKGGFTWDMSANITSVANKIISLPFNKTPNNRVGGYEVAAGKIDANGKFPKKWIAGRQEGGKLGELVAYKQLHVFRDWDDVKQNANYRIDEVANLYGPGLADQINPQTNKPYKESAGWQPIEPGDACWEDINGDNIINGYDRSVVGNIFPNITGGFSTTFGYKGISLYARFDYAMGHTLYNDLKARTLGQYQGSFNLIKEVKNMWSEENPNTDLTKFYYADQLSKRNITRSNNAATAADNNSSRYYEKADYLALREITLSYQLPKSLISKAHLTDASVYITGQNLFYITGYEGASPEPAVTTTYGRGIDNGRYPTPRTVLFGLSLTF